MKTWKAPPKNLILPDNVVHVWKATLNPPAWQIPALRNTLSPDELSRAERFRFEKHRLHYIVGRGILRTILGNYLHTAPNQLDFDYTQYGKPFLGNNFQEHGLKFNLAHSGTMALYGFVNGRELGIDIEQMRPNVDHAEIARRFFSSGEIATLNTLPPTDQRQGFFDCWTRKEAYIKAHGQGLSLPLDSFDVSPMSDAPPQTLRDRA